MISLLYGTSQEIDCQFSANLWVIIFGKSGPDAPLS